ncbi:MAG: ankyrin repeat domain-containing protein [Candidatus Hydrogenedentes bacterium]|nr:ankyrin repeat domain-containing protein [Candidatus Hydrogenedentota bacterium]
MRKVFIGIVRVVLATVFLGAVGCGRVPTTGSGSIYQAAETGDVGALREMLRKGFDVNAPDDAGMTLLHHAAAGNQAEVVEMLINEYPAKSNVTDNEGRTPLDVAIQMDCQDAAIVLENEEQ